MPEMTESDAAALAAYRGELSDQVSAFVCGGLDREKRMRHDWLLVSGMYDLWRSTEHGRKKDTTHEHRA